MTRQTSYISTWLGVVASCAACSGAVDEATHGSDLGGTSQSGATASGGSGRVLGGAGGIAGTGATGTLEFARGGSHVSATTSQASGGTSTAGPSSTSTLTTSVGGTSSMTTSAIVGGSTSTSAGAPSKGGSTSTSAGAPSKGGSTSGSTTSTTPSSAGSGGAAGAGGSSSTAPSWPLRKFVGNTTTSEVADPEGLVFSQHWDQITPENAGKWGSVQAQVTGAYNWSRLDAIYAYAKQNGLLFKEHTFIWGAGSPLGVITEAAVKDWMTQFCLRYPKTDLIDVVNEPPPHTTPNYVGALGGGTGSTWQWITRSFELAREACPGAVLILNDYYNVEYQSNHDYFLNIVKTIQAAGAPIDAIGVEGHSFKSSGITLSDVQKRVSALHTETGLPIYITEFDATADDAGQLALFQTYVPYFLNTDYIRGITFWGWINGKTWITNSGLVSPGGVPRPAMTWLMQTLGRPVP